MSKKNKPDTQGFVYSTDPSFRFTPHEEQAQETLPTPQQKLRIKLDTKHRAGKAVTLVEGFIGTDDDLQNLGKKLKNYCLVWKIRITWTKDVGPITSFY